MLFGVYGWHISVSAVSLSEAPFGFLALCAIDLFLGEIASQKPCSRRLLISAAMLAVGGFMRQEAWQLTAFLTLILLCKPQVRRNAIFFAVVGMSSFVIWGLFNVFSGGSFLTGVTQVATIKASEAILHTATKEQTLRIWISAFKQSPGPFVVLLALYGIWSSIKRRLHVEGNLIAASLFVPFFVMSVFAKGWSLQFRYMVLFSVLVLPCAGLAFASIKMGRRAAYAGLAALVALTVAWQVYAFGRTSHLGLPVPDRPPADTDICRFIAGNRRQDDRVMVESYQLGGPWILLESGAFSKRSGVVEPDSMQDSIAGTSATRPTLLVLESLTPEMLIRGPFQADIVYSNGVYTAYRVSYPGKDSGRALRE